MTGTRPLLTNVRPLSKPLNKLHYSGFAIMQNGGKLYDENTKKADWTSEPNKTAMSNAIARRMVWRTVRLYTRETNNATIPRNSRSYR